MARGPVRRSSDGTFALVLGPDERALLGTLTAQLRELLTTDSPVLARLFPPPYGDDTERNEGYAALAGPELVEHRTAALDLVTTTLEADRLTQEELEAWMRSINDLRLVLGTVLEVTDDEQEPDVDEHNAATYGAYEYLGYLLDSIVHALMD